MHEVFGDGEEEGEPETEDPAEIEQRIQSGETKVTQEEKEAIENKLFNQTAVDMAKGQRETSEKTEDEKLDEALEETEVETAPLEDFKHEKTPVAKKPSGNELDFYLDHHYTPSRWSCSQ